VLEAIDHNTKIIFACSPNNPTGNLLKKEDIVNLLESFEGIVVVDEAYIDFAPGNSFLSLLDKFPNLIVLQTFSKAWGMAGLRLGMAFASEDIIGVFNKIKYPYNVNEATQKLASEGLKNILIKEEMVADILTERERLKEELQKLPVVEKIFPSDANFILVRVVDADAVYTYLTDKKIITRNRSKVLLCANSLRVTVGKREEDDALIKALSEFNL
jgi:histidinol-phosphate aminotransferase